MKLKFRCTNCGNTHEKDVKQMFYFDSVGNGKEFNLKVFEEVIVNFCNGCI